jgi:hypothetical protein
MRRDDLGRWLLGVASLAAVVFDAIWGGFEPAHQPIHALGDHIPGVTALAIVYAAFAAFWLPRFVTAPRVLGYHPAVYIGVLASGLCPVSSAWRISLASCRWHGWFPRGYRFWGANAYNLAAVAAASIMAGWLATQRGVAFPRRHPPSG